MQVTQLRMAGSRVHTEPILQNPAETINRLKFQQWISSARDRAASSLCIKRCSGQISLFLEELGFHFMYPYIVTRIKTGGSNCAEHTIVEHLSECARF